MSFGEFQGKKKSEVESHPFFGERKKDKLRTEYPGGESYQDLFLRLKHPIEEILKTCDQIPFIIGHESVNRIIPGIINPSKFPLEQIVHNRQKNNEIVIISDDSAQKIKFSNN